MVKIFLDTKALLEYLAGKESIVDKVRQYVGKEELCITSITYLEVSLVLRDDMVKEEIGNSFAIVEISKEISDKASEIYDYLEEIRKPNIREVITAASCIVNNAYLIPGERKSYVDVPGIKLI